MKKLYQVEKISNIYDQYGKVVDTEITNIGVFSTKMEALVMAKKEFRILLSHKREGRVFDRRAKTVWYVSENDRHKPYIEISTEIRITTKLDL